MTDTCPHCNASLIGEPIPEEQRESYGGHTNFSRAIALYSQERDMTVSYQCPNCGGQRDR